MRISAEKLLPSERCSPSFAYCLMPVALFSRYGAMDSEVDGLAGFFSAEDFSAPSELAAALPSPLASAAGDFSFGVLSLRA